MSLETKMKSTMDLNLEDFCELENNEKKENKLNKQEKDIIIESLFPEYCGYFGDSQNMKYLQKCIPEAKFISTPLENIPYFAEHDVDLVYMGTMTEHTQERVIQKLSAYQERIKQMIEKGVHFLLTGNSIEIFSQYIEKENGEKIQGLEIFPIHAKRDMMHRHNSLFVGRYEDIKIVGFRSQFTFAYGENTNCYFAKVEKGIGLNPESTLEGIKMNHCIATYLLGPICILNPDFTRKLLQELGIEEPTLAFEEDVKEAYKQRLKEFENL